MAESNLLSMLSSALGVGIHLIIEVILIVIAATVARRKDGSAGALMAGAGGIFLLTTILWPVFSFGMGRLVSGTESILAFYAGFQVLMSLIDAAAWALLLVGIVKLGSSHVPLSKDWPR